MFMTQELVVIKCCSNRTYSTYLTAMAAMTFSSKQNNDILKGFF